jgi:hypothetical protein
MADRVGTFSELYPDKVIVSMAVTGGGRIFVATKNEIFTISTDGIIRPAELTEKRE